MPVWTDIAQSSSRMVLRLHAWWTEHCPEGDIPDRSMLFPEEVAGLLPYMMIAEIEPAPFRVRYRLVGTKVVANAGFDFTGGYLDVLEPEVRPIDWMECYRQVVATRAPLMGSVEDRAVSGTPVTYEFAILPLRHGGSAVAQCISVEDYFGFEARSAQWSR
jgi:hypothetical protein